MMGVERKTDNNNVITSTRVNSTPSSPSSTSSPSSRPRRSRLTSSPSSGGGVGVSTVPKSAVTARTSGTATQPGRPVGIGEAIRRIPTAGGNRHSLMSGDTRLLNAHNNTTAASKATTPTSRLSRESEKKTTPPSVTQPLSASGKALVRRRTNTDAAATSVSNITSNKGPARSAVPVRKVNSSSVKRKSLTPGSVSGSSKVPSEGGSPADITRQAEPQRRLRTDPVGRAGTSSRLSGHDTANTTAGKTEPSHIPCSSSRQSGTTRTPASISTRPGAGVCRGGGRVATGGGTGRVITSLTPSTISTIAVTSTSNAASTKVTSNTTSLSTNVTISTRICTSIIPASRRSYSISSSIHTQTGGFVYTWVRCGVE
ncbi:putative protein TPRXL [Homarus americanus]|uniref:putative protein TPRXL n=1 Tax=Homarus americanus TaxID=6706 RepID=UPI001C463030|nr:putative protein TPRXL [Homarus americanus]XP_042234846.1 putative protein TPRXL [Homarus americanus]XP_042234848.1 putative protein TPRXL [Homarus americanus]